MRVGARRPPRPPVQQALTESLLLAVAGSLIGVPLAIWATRALARLQTFGVPLLQNASVDPDRARRHDRAHRPRRHRLRRAAGAPPRARAGRRSRTPRISAAPGRSSAFARNALVVVEVALACVLLVGAGLLIRSFSALLQRRPRLPAASTPWRGASIRRARSTASPRPTPYLDGAVRSVAAIPGVDAVGLSDVLPLGRNRTWGVRAKGVEYPPGQAPSVFPRIVDEHYLQAMQIPLRAGRFFDARDTADRRKGRHHQRESGAAAVAGSRRRRSDDHAGWRHDSHRRRRQRPPRLARGSRRQRDVSALPADAATGRGWRWSCAARGRRITGAGGPRRARRLRSEPAERRVLRARTADRQRRRAAPADHAAARRCSRRWR